MRSVALLLLCATAVLCGRAEAKAKLEDYASEVRRLMRKEDYLGARVVARKMMRANLSPVVWRDVRRSLHADPAVGWDILRDWEKVSPLKSIPTEADRLLAEGIGLMRKRQFDSAFGLLQDAARLMKKGEKKGARDNEELYLFTLHMMGRALFGAGRLDEAFKVYSWVPATYSDYRRVIFERMWSAFRAKKISEAVGALASQYSSYLGPYLEPEAYLVQIYIYRKLCRTADLKLTLKNVRAFRDAISEQKYEMYDWLRSDLTTRPYVRVLEQRYNPSSSFVNEVARDNERWRLSTLLAKRFDHERKRLLIELDRVLAFSSLSFSATSKELPKIVKMPPPKVLSKSGLEMWPVDDAEDWLDEHGKHIFTGDTQCASRSR